jgi:hypothetical protein
VSPPLPTAGEAGGCGAPVWSPGHIVPQGERQSRASWAQDMPVKPQNLTERSSWLRSWSITKLLVGTVPQGLAGMAELRPLFPGGGGPGGKKPLLCHNPQALSNVQKKKTIAAHVTRW